MLSEAECGFEARTLEVEPMSKAFNHNSKTDCEGGNPIKAGVGGNVPLVAVDLGQYQINDSPLIKVAVRPRSFMAKQKSFL